MSEAGDTLSSESNPANGKRKTKDNIISEMNSLIYILFYIYSFALFMICLVFFVINICFTLGKFSHWCLLYRSSADANEI